MVKGRIGYIIIMALLSVNGWAQNGKAVKQLPPVSSGNGGRLVYAANERGDRIPDFSYCGYKGGDEAIPVVPVKVVVPVITGDATVRIQAALDYVADLVPDKNGFRGAVLLQAGVYRIEGALKIHASGVVLRGSGATGNSVTVLTGAGYSRQTLITVAGVNDRHAGRRVAVSDVYVPVNAGSVHVADGSAFKTGDHVLIQRACTAKWIDLLGTDHFGGGITSLGWKPGQRTVEWDRVVTKVSNNELQLDAPLTTSLDTTYGSGTVAAYEWSGRISQVGVENLICESEYNTANAKDEDHRWMAVVLENVRDAWVRQVVFKHFAGSAVAVQETGSRVTVEDVQSLEPVSEIGGQRRNTFFTSGQQCLFQRAYAEYGFHDFGTGYCAPGPNAFVQCESHLPYSFSGGIDSWASGVLFDIVNVDGQALSYMNRGQDGQGAGWAAANSVFWQCSAARVDCYQPPGAQNWAFGTWAQFQGDGYWDNSNETINPRSLYYAQLKDRLGDVSKRAWLLPVETEASSSPSVEVAAALTAQSVAPRKTLQQFIAEASQRDKIDMNAGGVKTIDQIGFAAPKPLVRLPDMVVQNGWLVRGNTVLTGIRREVPWWSGSVKPNGLLEAKPHITRFVPGRTGLGLTDDLDDMTDTMKANGWIALDHNYGLWYERRRDDHERIRRIDGDVWPPFYELPFARSGKDSAWDGLSKYDLTRYNKFYWSRLQQYASLADSKGLVLIHENYFQHNIIEAGAHYADFPWRTANNINQTGFPEPVPFAGDKRIFMAEQFYDITNPARRAIHRAYIRQCLDNFTSNSGVVQLIGAEFTGPLHFVQFWVDVIKEWEQEHHRRVVVGLSVTKDVQDALLQDKERASVIDLIDIRYWHYQFNGTTYAPEGGKSLAPRQWARLLKPKRSSFEQVYRAVSEYRKQYPGKAVMYSGDGFDAFGWAAFMAGGSLCAIPAVDTNFLKAASGTLPVDTTAGESGCYWLAQQGKNYILYSTGVTAAPSLNLTGVQGSFILRWIDPRSGKAVAREEKLKAGSVVPLKAPQGQVIAWISKI